MFHVRQQAELQSKDPIWAQWRVAFQDWFQHNQILESEKDTYKELLKRINVALERGVKPTVIVPVLLPDGTQTVLVRSNPAIVEEKKNVLYFPQGRMESEGDTPGETLFMTALREVYEELGVLPDQVRFVRFGPLLDVPKKPTEKGDVDKYYIVMYFQLLEEGVTFSEVPVKKVLDEKADLKEVAAHLVVPLDEAESQIAAGDVRGIKKEIMRKIFSDMWNNGLRQ